jgi:hypothetical protein
MEDNDLIRMQNDLKKSNPIILNNNDDISKIKKKFSNKYTDDVSDSDDDLSSYRKRNNNIINQVSKTKVNKARVNKVVKKEDNSDQEDEEDDENNKNNQNNQKRENNDEDNSDSENSEVEYEYSQEFKEKVKTYVKNDDKIRELQQEIKKLNVIKKTAEMDILKHLERLGENNINITGGKLRINQYESKDSLKETIIKEAITEKIKDPKIMENIIEIINEKRVNNAKIQVSLKRTFERGKK